MTSSSMYLILFICPVLVATSVFLALISWQEVWDRTAIRYVNDLMPTIEALNIDKSKIPKFLRIWGLCILCTFGLVFLAPPLAIAAVFLVYVAPRLYLNWLISRRRTLIRDQLVGVSAALANTTRAGLSLAQGLEAVGKDTPEPLAHEIRTIVSDFQHGLPLPTAIESTKQRLRHDSFTLMAASLLTSLERGGRITDALDRISKSLQENQRLERKMESETASGKRVLTILAVFPLLFLGLFFLVYPEGTIMLFSSLTGQFILLAVIGLVYFSFTWGQRILKIE
ncbi:MAG: hypothetical protein HKN47_16735 [Pirellulaceae bacterium]|nr:hypothetical protein [Pirellulaceae bacterium]